MNTAMNQNVVTGSYYEIAAKARSEALRQFFAAIFQVLMVQKVSATRAA